MSGVKVDRVVAKAADACDESGVAENFAIQIGHESVLPRGP